MRRVLVLALLLLAAAGAQGATRLTLTDSQVSPQLIATGSYPAVLSAGAAGSTTVGPNATSAQSSVTGDGTRTSHHTATVTSQWESVQRLRLRLLSTSGSLAECAECSIELRNGQSVKTQISIVNGATTISTGDWFNFGSGASIDLHAIVQANGTADETVVLEYAAEIVPNQANSPVVSYYAMRMTFSV